MDVEDFEPTILLEEDEDRVYQVIYFNEILSNPGLTLSKQMRFKKRLNAHKRRTRWINRPLFLGLINWERPKIRKSKITERIDPWLNYLEFSRKDSTELFSNIYGQAKPYYNEETGNFEPKISLWGFFTQDQNPAKFTKGKFRALGKDKEIVEPVSKTKKPGKFLLDEFPPILLEEEVKKGKYFSLGEKWKFRGKDQEADTFSFRGFIPKIRDPANAILIPIDHILINDYLVPPLRREITVLTSDKEMKKAVEKLKTF